jgi:hypothetical protein
LLFALAAGVAEQVDLTAMYLAAAAVQEILLLCGFLLLLLA